MELLVIIAFIYAVHSAVEDTKAALRKSRAAYRTSADVRFPKAGKSRRAVHAARHDSGFWIGQAAQAFPAARHGLAAGWHAGRKAQAEGREAREKAKAEHLEARVQLIPEVRRHLERQRAALEQIRAEREAQAAQPGGREGSPQPVMAPPSWAPGVVGWPGPGRSNGESAERPGEGGENAGEESPAVPVPVPEAPAEPEADGRTYSYGPAVSPYAWPVGTDAEKTHAYARRMSGDGSPQVVTEYPPGGGPGRTVAVYRGGVRIQPTEAQVAEWDAEAGKRRQEYRRQEEPAAADPAPEASAAVPEAASASGRPEITRVGEMFTEDGALAYRGWGLSRHPDLADGDHDLVRGDVMGRAGYTVAELHEMSHGPGCTCPVAAFEETGPSAPPQSPQPEGEPTVPAADTTYDGVLASMSAEKDNAEQRAAEQQQAGRRASSMSEQMQALEVDSATLSAMADHLDAHDTAVRAQQHVQETAEAVEAALKRGHAGLSEAHKDAPVTAADKTFYAE